MTQEEKARAYDEALNKAKIEINTKGIGEAVNLCYQLFPQLAESDDEESDDERIRKRLIEYFEGFRMGNAEVRWEGLIVQEVLAWLKKQKECVADNSKTSTDEDERIINQLITLVNSAGEVLLIPTNKEELVAWLNKCKESLHIPETCKENAYSFTDGIIEVRSFQRGMEEGRRLERQKEHKPQTDDEKEYVRTIKSIISDFIRDKKPENLAYYQRIYDWLDGRHVPFSCSQENGQPVDPVFSKQEYESYPIISEDTTSTKPVEFDGKTLLYTADKSYQIGFRDGVASVKPEWSEEDEHRRDGVIQWLREYQEKFNPKYDSLSIESIESLIDWLKSIRPQSQGIYQQVVKGIRDMCDRYEQNGMFTDERARDFLGNVRVKCKDAIECAPILDEPSWKPTDEQMDRLFSIVAALRKDCCDDMADFLASIYHNLKELM